MSFTRLLLIVVFTFAWVALFLFFAMELLFG
jgi:hypothetical protein